ncbi:MAG: flagellin lysine-N-methylase [Oscillospiraceae bacterium]|nr:flagellin lysine-N-methylase [Oscillospiraceae bacterium]
MKQIVPDYYPRFRCIAGACRHSCCIGWEIDIDEDTPELYRSVGGDLGARLQANIDWNSETPHFILGDHDRCPFLNSDNLCDLIIGLGEEALCGICDMHPRFCNEFSDRTEIGLGLSCEEAARLILTTATPVQLICIEDDGEDTQPEEDEAYLYAMRRNAIAIAQDRTFTIKERMENLSDYFGFPLPKENPLYWAEAYMGLERLDEGWTAALETLKQAFVPKQFPLWENAFEQLLVYFLYRHCPTALYDGDLESKVAFAVLSVQMLMWLCEAKEDTDFADLLEFVRMYSGEIEYSDENPDALFALLAADSDCPASD